MCGERIVTVHVRGMRRRDEGDYRYTGVPCFGFGYFSMRMYPIQKEKQL